MDISYAASCVLDVYPDLSPEAVEKRLTYASFASIERRLLYLEVPKAASTTIKQLLRNEASPRGSLLPKYRESRRELFVHRRANVPLPSLNSLPKLEQRELMEAPDVLRFTVVRNPYARLASAWADKVMLCEPGFEDVYFAIRGEEPPVGRKTPINFDEFVSYLEATNPIEWNEHWRLQLMLAFPKVFSFNHIGKVENIEETERVLSERGLGKMTSSNLRVVRLSPYTPELAGRVNSLYVEDFDVFGYDRGSWEPQNEANINLDQFIDAVIERNLIISGLCRERDELIKQRDNAYRFSLLRVANKLRSILPFSRREDHV